MSAARRIYILAFGGEESCAGVLGDDGVKTRLVQVKSVALDVLKFEAARGY
jgi:hypothetical protein